MVMLATRARTVEVFLFNVFLHSIMHAQTTEEHLLWCSHVTRTAWSRLVAVTLRHRIDKKGKTLVQSQLFTCVCLCAFVCICVCLCACELR